MDEYTESDFQDAFDAGYEHTMSLIFESSRSMKDIKNQCAGDCSDLVGYDLADWAYEGVMKAINEMFQGPKNKRGIF